ncbi:autotransporter outer membrane beta-barrel domain-containing protein, partial [Salmonella enterica subsp. enterica serovar Alachua]|nr:autotransporter outer membrane beta-barrel domain-containing protein [Salmonella enterica subsp. enterica serovar Alachua]
MITFDQSDNVNFACNILGLSGLNGIMIKDGAGYLTLDGISTLDWSILAGSLSTAAERFSGDVFIASDAILSFEQPNNAVYNATLSGTGSFVKSGGGALIYNGLSADFSGNTAIDTGSLIVGLDEDHASAVLGGSVLV